ncbi:MAG: glutamine-hydrolyzing GMP synthase [Candidatus Marinimicrobia bacterium]|jgi:GMP synthase (glutamine-hydrolysing)|uniref:GMP synthase [glutamine-hydrolyzing] n=1 Tax=uncultured bacterium FGYC_13M19 TaxID=1343844 RepID=S4W9W0_9BACT|nr:synthase [glutamine-hydrolyzing] [uncultured bacterium FGYC_13M19]MBT3217405.1 glutamine-hydrolyzing GMP synthase [Candidatus Neomarinimicrobiota bacterium]MBT3618691.1 glutamine-hydrolyzing GMP synthase [Candidatus Neomarinimicrobiota bacterium]MBT3828557.1 glutamine-hydrolyzing GMP synthase [Candidatus Neomarinimicrobiota bacterium]MBT3996711.1 glutamine-hydrolyzing GMP synthase [Candidatus Neomarinimicrobiota bacterium]
MNESHKHGVVVLDFGSQYTQLIARRIRENNVFSEILPHNASINDIMERAPKAVILSGGPSSVFDDSAYAFDPEIFTSDFAVLGICYGLQLMVHHFKGTVEPGTHGEYGFASVKVLEKNNLFEDVPEESKVWMSHMDRVSKIPAGWEKLAESSNGIVAAMCNVSEKLYATQFHPEVAHTEFGLDIIQNFLFKVAGCAPTWTPGLFIDEQVALIRKKIGDAHVLCGVSGGVDSSVVAALLHKAIGDQCTGVLIDHGMMRKDEADSCVAALKKGLGMQIESYDESEIFLHKLDGISEPEQKRKIIGEQFIRSFERISKSLGEFKFLAQGTLYPDVIESGMSINDSAETIKSHHNVGGLPDNIKFQLIEPLKELFKDEVREVGRELGLPESLVGRHPFPGPGLGIRIMGNITKDRLKTLREADYIYMSILRDENLYDEIWQAFSVLLPVKTVGVMGDQRTYEDVLAIRAVTSTDGMTADWYHMPDEVLSKIANKIVNSVRGINRVVYDITSKPPGTIEWE